VFEPPDAEWYRQESAQHSRTLHQLKTARMSAAQQNEMGVLNVNPYRCPNCESVMTRGDCCSECVHTENGGPCECETCAPDEVVDVIKGTTKP
jgi:hypothetical protein